VNVLNNKKGRNEITLKKEDIIEAIKEVVEENGKLVQKYVANKLGVSYPTYLREKERHGLDPKAISLSPRIPELEAVEYTEQEFEDHMYNLRDSKKEESYETFHYKFDESIILRPIFDPHIGAPSTLYGELWDDLKQIKHSSNIKTFFGGDVIDNFTKFSPGSAVYSQLIPPPQQKADMEWITKYLGKNKLLGVLQGCHDEWSKKTDDFGMGKYLANSIGVPYLGFGALLKLEVGENIYKVYVSHDDRYFSKYNLTHGLKREWREETDFDLGISGHRHRSDGEWFVEKQRSIKVLKCSGYKARDRFLKQQKKEKYLYRSECAVLLAEKIESIDLGIVLFEDIRHAIRFL